jgi:cyclopropane-fatty-acyl-phospholipid synthase
MGLFSLEHGRAAYFADFAFYGLWVAVLAALAARACPAGLAWQAAACGLAGLAGWTLVEYALHRYVLHGVQPFCRWHAMHHDRPRALIASPTLFTASLFGVLVFAPALWLTAPWQACAMMAGVLTGYLAYAALHHLAHHGHIDGVWMRRHQRWHALHHRRGSEACYGVSLPLWDHVFGSARPAALARRGP